MREKKVAKEKNETEKTDPLALYDAYSSICQRIGIEVGEMVKRALTITENGNQGKQIIIQQREKEEGLGPGGWRALSMALLGNGNNSLKELRVWRVHVGEEGCFSVAELLRLGGAELRIDFLELLDCGVGKEGGRAFGRALSCGVSLLLFHTESSF